MIRLRPRAGRRTSPPSCRFRGVGLFGLLCALVAAGAAAGAPLPVFVTIDPQAYLVERVLPLAQDLRDGKAQLSLERKTIDFTAAECALVLELLTHVVGEDTHQPRIPFFIKMGGEAGD